MVGGVISNIKQLTGNLFEFTVHDQPMEGVDVFEEIKVKGNIPVRNQQEIIVGNGIWWQSSKLMIEGREFEKISTSYGHKHL